MLLVIWDIILVSQHPTGLSSSAGVLSPIHKAMKCCSILYNLYVWIMRNVNISLFHVFTTVWLGIITETLTCLPLYPALSTFESTDLRRFIKVLHLSFSRVWSLCQCPVTQIISADTLHDEGERSGKCLNTIPFTFPTYYNKENDGSVFVVMEDQFGEHWTCGFVTEIFVGSAAKLFVFWSLSMSLWQIFREWRTEIDMQRRTQ